MKEWKPLVGLNIEINTKSVFQLVRSPMSPRPCVCLQRSRVHTNHSKPYTQSKVSVYTKQSLAWLSQRFAAPGAFLHGKAYSASLELPEAFHSKALDVNGLLR